MSSASPKLSLLMAGCDMWHVAKERLRIQLPPEFGFDSISVQFVKVYSNWLVLLESTGQPISISTDKRGSISRSAQHAFGDWSWAWWRRRRSGRSWERSASPFRGSAHLFPEGTDQIFTFEKDWNGTKPNLPRLNVVSLKGFDLMNLTSALDQFSAILRCFCFSSRASRHPVPPLSQALQLKGESRYGLKAALSNGIPRARWPSCPANAANGAIAKHAAICSVNRCADENDERTSKRWNERISKKRNSETPSIFDESCGCVLLVQDLVKRAETMVLQARKSLDSCSYLQFHCEIVWHVVSHLAPTCKIAFMSCRCTFHHIDCFMRVQSLMEVDSALQCLSLRTFDTATETFLISVRLFLSVLSRMTWRYSGNK